MAWLAELEEARLESLRNRGDPWARTLERAVRDIDAISSVALLDLLGVPPTTGNARRLAQTMRALGFVGIKSRRLMPGGFRDTTIRGWARPLFGTIARGRASLSEPPKERIDPQAA